MSGAQGAEPMGSRTATTYESVEGGQNKTKLDIRSKEDEGYEMLVFDDEILSSNDERALNLTKELNQTDILVIVAVNNSESVNWIQENSRNVKNMICFESSSNLMNRLGGNDIGSVNKDKQITEVVKTVGDAWERLPVLQNLRSKGFSTLTCMVKNCGPQILNCLLDPNCRKALQCLNQCSPVDQVCSYRCIASYESPYFEAFSLCVLQKHNCLELDAKIPEKPYVPPMTSFRGKELCHDTAEDLFVGWLGELDWSWRVVAGQNPAYDQFPCQYQLFYRGKGKSSFWYEPVFQVRTLEEKLVWRRRRYSVKRGKIPATFRFSVLDNGVVSNEFWTIVDVSDDLSWGLFHYNGAARVAGQSYTGAVLVTPDGSYPAEKEKERLQSALEKCGIKEWELFAVDNCSCENPPLGIPQGSRLHSRISIIEEPDSEEKFN
ncbi:unnamed protein product [Arabidopsis halleri]